MLPAANEPGAEPGGKNRQGKPHAADPETTREGELAFVRNDHGDGECRERQGGKDQREAKRRSHDRDLRRPTDWALAFLVGAGGFAFNLAVAVALGLTLYWLGRAIGALWPPEPAADSV